MLSRDEMVLLAASLERDALLLNEQTYTLQTKAAELQRRAAEKREQASALRITVELCTGDSPEKEG